MIKVESFWCHEASNIRCVRESDYAALEQECELLRKAVASVWGLKADGIKSHCLDAGSDADLVALITEVRSRCPLPDWARIRIDAALQAKP